jgi:hypothetical protein
VAQGGYLERHKRRRPNSAPFDALAAAPDAAMHDAAMLDAPTGASNAAWFRLGSQPHSSLHMLGLGNFTDAIHTDLDLLTLSNVPPGSSRMWAHLLSVYVIALVALKVCVRRDTHLPCQELCSIKSLRQLRRCVCCWSSAQGGQHRGMSGSSCQAGRRVVGCSVCCAVQWLWDLSRDVAFKRAEFLATQASNTPGSSSVLVTDIPGLDWGTPINRVSTSPQRTSCMHGTQTFTGGVPSFLCSLPSCGCSPLVGIATVVVERTCPRVADTPALVCIDGIALYQHTGVLLGSDFLQCVGALLWLNHLHICFVAIG